GVSVVMLMVSLVITVLTQAITNLMQARGRNLLDGIASLLRQIDSGLPEEISRKIADGILTHPLVRSAGAQYGVTVHREELIALLLQLASDDGAHRLETDAREQLCNLLRKNGVEHPTQTLANVRALVLQLEQAHPELSNHERYAAAFLKEAS